LFSGLAGWLVPQRWRLGVILTGSLAALYWLQPASPVRNLDFWLPTAAIALTLLAWAITYPKSHRQEIPDQRNNSLNTGWRAAFPGVLLIIGVVLLVGLTRYLGPLCCLTASRPPEAGRILAVIGLIVLVVVIFLSLSQRSIARRQLLPGAIVLLILAIFIVLKSTGLGTTASAWLRSLSGQSAGLAAIGDLRWLGFSYLAFRLLHVLRDAQAGKLPPFSLAEFAAYALFFPAYPSGPIDRAQHLVPELRSPYPLPGDRLDGAWRIYLGVFKKFVLADSLALFALNAQNAAQTTPGGWTWLLLYAYTLRIYFDFSGYTDVALGLARLVGVRLPENFDRPYLRTNLTAFWNSWHITLAQWFRAYFFNPFTRWLRSRPAQVPVWLVIFSGQLATMALIGLWHGITWNFFIWGAWHGIGLFVHNRWTEWNRSRMAGLSTHPRWARPAAFLGWLVTFHYVALGWVWFALPDLPLALETFRNLLGVG
jgi:D-alanyl-lipoteichoic acid acyltransferase DltB (MBOAT superfamily)